MAIRRSPGLRRADFEAPRAAAGEIRREVRRRGQTWQDLPCRPAPLCNPPATPCNALRRRACNGPARQCLHPCTPLQPLQGLASLNSSRQDSPCTPATSGLAPCNPPAPCTPCCSNGFFFEPRRPRPARPVPSCTPCKAFTFNVFTSFIMN